MADDREAMKTTQPPLPDCDASPAQLNDFTHREELRERYDGLLQEIRVILPGALVVLGFQLAVPFSAGFDSVDALGHRVFTVATVIGLAGAVSLMTPSVFHRLGDRRARAARLMWGERLLLVGAFLTATSLICSMWTIIRFIHGGLIATVVAALAVVLVTILWVIVPLSAKPEVSET